MKVLFLVNIPSPYRVDFFQELGQICDLTVLYELPKASDRNEKWECNLEKKSYREVFLKPVLKQTSSAWCPSVKKYLKDNSYNIIVIGGYSTPTGMQAIFYLKRRKISYLLNCDGGIISRQENCLKRNIKHWFIKGAGGYLCTGSTSREYLEFYGADKEKIFCYPFTSLKEKDLLRLPLLEEEKKKYKDELELRILEKKMVVAVGDFSHRKGFDILLNAASMIESECEIFLVGGEETQEYKEIRERNHLGNIHYISFLTKDELKKYYYAADLFVLPTREDIWGLVINEAMGAGLPVITTEKCVAGIEMLDSNFLVPIERADLLAEKMDELLSDGEKLRKAGKENLKKCSNYTIENMAKVHMEIFHKIQEEISGFCENLSDDKDKVV